MHAGRLQTAKPAVLVATTALSILPPRVRHDVVGSSRQDSFEYRALVTEELCHITWVWESLWEEMSGSLQPSTSLDSQDRKLGSQEWKSQLLLTPSVVAAFSSWIRTEQTLLDGPGPDQGSCQSVPRNAG